MIVLDPARQPAVCPSCVNGRVSRETTYLPGPPFDRNLREQPYCRACMYTEGAEWGEVTLDTMVGGVKCQAHSIHIIIKNDEKVVLFIRFYTCMVNGQI